MARIKEVKTKQGSHFKSEYYLCTDLSATTQYNERLGDLIQRHIEMYARDFLVTRFCVGSTGDIIREQTIKEFVKWTEKQLSDTSKEG